MPIPVLANTSYKISEFAHLYDVAFGVNLAYSLLEQVHNSWHQNYKDTLASVMKHCLAIAEPGINGVAINSHIKAIHENRLLKYEMKSKTFVYFFRVWALLAAMILVSLLCFIGFHPETLLSLSEAWSIIIFLVVPVPLSSIILFVSWKIKVFSLRNELAEHQKLLVDERDAALKTLQGFA